ncbi:protein-methionine sulfoxide oxidase mical3b-like isoform X2 [Mya arenaria]|uniref:protein-methionine sulfoxide oxidase mical3b-like isoform X2 n=1 Tax=Mya arenaria TaxID=6604 RepID=UPI0022E82F18|nr:protein-methionine sulfoxide oxidase mical3b-like isoform X2 [Mya arenaria]
MLLLGSDVETRRGSVPTNGLVDEDNGVEGRCMMENGVAGDSDLVSGLFDQFCHASTCRAIITAFQALTDHVGLTHADHRNFYRKLRARINTWKAHALWVKMDKRASHKEYKRGEACANTKVIIIGGGICGLRCAIEMALLGARTVVMEKRDRFSRNNVLHLWPFLIVDLKNLGAKKFYGKFCAGAIDHISIRQLQCILLKVALLVGVEVHLNVSFLDVIEPSDKSTGWRVKLEPEDHPLSEYEFDVLIGADGKRNTLQGFKRKEFRGKLAIAITANFINRNSQAEARVEEISGVAFIFNQKFFKDLNAECGIDLENIVYYKDETHYFVMTAKKQSLLEKGVLKRDYVDTASLLAKDNVNQDTLESYAREAADFCTKHKMPHLDFAVNHFGRPDISMFDFTSLFQAENSCRVMERHGKKLLTMLVGDSLLEPFWPTGSGCARGFLGAFDGAWMVKQWSSGKMTPLQVIAERESVYQQLSQTTPENLRQNHSQFTLDPASRYTNLKAKWLKAKQVQHLYDTGDNTLKDELIEIPKPKPGEIVDTYSLLRWCQKIVNVDRYRCVNVTDFSTSWRSGMAFCALMHFLKSEAIDYDSLDEADVVGNNQLAFDVAQREFSITPVLTGEDMAACERPDKLTIVSYLTQLYDHFKKQRPPSEEFLNSSWEESRKHRSPAHKISILQKLRSSRVSLSKLKKSIKREHDDVERHNNVNNSCHGNGKVEKIGKVNSVFTNPNYQARDVSNGNVELTRFSKVQIDKLPIAKINDRLYEGNAKHDDPYHRTKDSMQKLPMDEITNRLTTEKADELKAIKMREQMMPVVKVSKMAELLVSKFKKNSDEPPPEPLTRRVKGQPMMVASQPASEFCFFCKKRVYIMERMSAENVFFHSQCFKCDFCGVVLRTNTYSVDKTSYGDATRFFCQRHALPQMRWGKPARKRVAEDAPDMVSNKMAVADTTNIGPPPSKQPSMPASTKKIPDMLSPVKNIDDLAESLKTPERVEFELEGLEEETEEEQWEHNMSMSLCHDEDLGVEDLDQDEDSDSDLESEDEDFQEAVDLYTSGRLEESLHLAKESLRRSTEDLLVGEADGYMRLEEGEDTEVDEYEGETDTDDSDTEMEEDTMEPPSQQARTEPVASDNAKSISEPSNSISVSKSKSTNMSDVPKPVTSARSPGQSASQAKKNFFDTPPEPLRLDPFKMFGMERKNPVKEEAVVNKEIELNTGVGEMESDEVTDSQVNSGELDKAGRTGTPCTEDEADEAFVSAEFGDDEKVAVSRAMEQLLVDMDHRSESVSDSGDVLHANSEEEEGDDDVFRAYRQHLESRDSMGSLSGSEGPASSHSKHSLASSNLDSKSSSSVDRLKSDSDSLKGGSLLSKKSVNNVDSTSEFGATEKSVLRSVKDMSDNSNSTLGSGETTLQVLRSVNEIKSGDDEKVERCIQYLDDRFVTKRGRGGSGAHESRSEKSSSLRRSGSSDSFTISTPSHSSNHTSNSSLGEEFEQNKNFLAANGSEDERPDSQMMEDYNTTMSQVLDEEELSPMEVAPQGVEDLDQTLHAEDVEAASPSLEYLSPRSELGDQSDRSEYQSPRSDRASSVYATPDTSLTEEVIVQQVIDTVSESVKNDTSNSGTKRKSSTPKGNSSKKSAKSESSKSSILGFSVKKKKSDTVKSPKVIKSEVVNTPVMPVKSKTIIRPYSHRSREGSVECNPLEKDAWGDSSSCGSLNSADASQKSWRPLPPLPTESLESPKQSKTVKNGAGRKLPDLGQTKSPVVFQSNFMKKAYNSNTDSGGDSSGQSVSPTPVITSQPRPLPPRPVVNQSGAVNKNSEQFKPVQSSELLSSGTRTKISVDYSKLTTNKESDSENDKKKKRIPVAAALKKSIKPTLSNSSATNEKRGEQSDDIPFADDSENDVPEERFFTPSTSVKPKLKINRKEGEKCDARKRILPIPPQTSPTVLDSEKIRDIRRVEMDKAREDARQRARLKSDEELGLRETPLKYKRGISTESSQSPYPSTSDRVSESDDVKTPLPRLQVSFTPNIPESNGTPKHSKTKKKKKSKSREGSTSSVEFLDSEVKKENKKKRSLLASILSGVKTPTTDKQRDRDGSSSNDTLEEKSTKKKKTKTPKSEKKKKDKKRKTASVDDSLLSDNMRELKIGSVFSEKTGRRPAFRTKISPPKASVDDFTDSDEEMAGLAASCTSLNDSYRRIKSDHGPLSEEELNARITRKIQHAARKQQKQQEQKRLRQAQEIQRKLQEVDVKQRELEEKGVNVERALRGEGPEGGRNETELMQEWFNLVHDKNALVRLESELMVSARELELEDRQGRLQHQLRESMSLDGLDYDDIDNDDVFEEPSQVRIGKLWASIRRYDSLKSPLQREREQRIYNELIDVVEERDKLVAMLEDERLREQEEDADLETVMRAKGFSLSPTSGSKILRKRATKSQA